MIIFKIEAYMLHFLMFFLCLWQAPTWAKNISVVSLSPTGAQTLASINGQEYKSQLITDMKKITSDLDNELSLRRGGAKWDLEYVAVGLGQNLEVGLGPFKIGASIRKRYFYTRN